MQSWNFSTPFTFTRTSSSSSMEIYKMFAMKYLLPLSRATRVSTLNLHHPSTVLSRCTLISRFNLPQLSHFRMSTSDSAFIPRKLAKSSSRNAGGTTRSQKSFPRQAEVASVPAASSSSLTQDQRKSVRYSEDSAYTTLFELALSEYALWSNHELMEVLEANEEGCE